MERGGEIHVALDRQDDVRLGYRAIGCSIYGRRRTSWEAGSRCSDQGDRAAIALPVDATAGSVVLRWVKQADLAAEQMRRPQHLIVHFGYTGGPAIEQIVVDKRVSPCDSTASEIWT